MSDEPKTMKALVRQINLQAFRASMGKGSYALYAHEEITSAFSKYGMLTIINKRGRRIRIGTFQNALNVITL